MMRHPPDMVGNVSVYGPKVAGYAGYARFRHHIWRPRNTQLRYVSFDSRTRSTELLISVLQSTFWPTLLEISVVKVGHIRIYVGYISDIYPHQSRVSGWRANHRDRCNNQHEKHYMMTCMTDLHPVACCSRGT